MNCSITLAPVRVWSSKPNRKFLIFGIQETLRLNCTNSNKMFDLCLVWIEFDKNVIRKYQVMLQ